MGTCGSCSAKEPPARASPAQADLNPQTVARILDGNRQRIRPGTEQLILGLRLPDVIGASTPGTAIAAAPTWALLDELIRRGWPKAWLGRELGLTSGLQLGREHVSAATAAKVADLLTARQQPA